MRRSETRNYSVLYKTLLMYFGVVFQRISLAWCNRYSHVSDSKYIKVSLFVIQSATYSSLICNLMFCFRSMILKGLGYYLWRKKDIGEFEVQSSTDIEGNLVSFKPEAGNTYYAWLLYFFHSLIYFICFFLWYLKLSVRIYPIAGSLAASKGYGIYYTWDTFVAYVGSNPPPDRFFADL